MRYQDAPTVEVTERINTSVEAAWEVVTDIALPAARSPELQSAHWLDGATGVAVGNRFQGRNANAVLGEWSTISLVVEVEPLRRWVWDVLVGDGVGARWAFEVEPARDGVVVRQWARLGPDPSGLTLAINAMPDKEARIIEHRLREWREAMSANLAAIKQRLEGLEVTD
jgi:hypothetical protein